MRKILIVLAFLISSVFAESQVAAIPGYCTLGASQAMLSGMLSTNYQQGIIPFCTVTVYLTGTLTPATIYSTSTLTPLSNPFPASNLGYWQFYASPSSGYDVVLSGGIAPNSYTNPVTITDVGGFGLASAIFSTPNNWTALQNFNAGLTANTATITTVTSTTTNSGTVNGVFYVPSNSTDWGASINAILATCPVDGSGYKQCEIHLPQGNGANWATTAVINSPGVSIIGQGVYTSVANCVVNGDCLRIFMSPFTVTQAGRFENFAMTGSGTPNGCGIHYGEIVGATFKNLSILNFTGANGCDMWGDNAHTNTWTERNEFDSVETGNSPSGWLFTVELGNPSFGYNRWINIGTNVNGFGGNTVFNLQNTAQLYNSTLRMTVNAQSTLVGTTNIFNLANTSQFQGELHLFGEGVATNLFKTAVGTQLNLSADSSINWGTATLPSSTILGSANWILGPAQGTAIIPITEPNSPMQLISLVPIWNLQLGGNVTFIGSSSNQARFTPSDDLNPTSAMMYGTNAANTIVEWEINKNGSAVFSSLNGTAAAKIPAVGTTAVGNVVCQFSAGPPVVLGHCTSVVGVGGACTCAN